MDQRTLLHIITSHNSVRTICLSHLPAFFCTSFSLQKIENRILAINRFIKISMRTLLQPQITSGHFSRRIPSHLATAPREFRRTVSLGLTCIFLPALPPLQGWMRFFGLPRLKPGLSFLGPSGPLPAFGGPTPHRKRLTVSNINQLYTY